MGRRRTLPPLGGGSAVLTSPGPSFVTPNPTLPCTTGSTGSTAGLPSQRTRNCPLSSSARIQERFWFQSFAGMCQRPPAASSANANTGNASAIAPPTAATWRQPKWNWRTSSMNAATPSPTASETPSAAGTSSPSTAGIGKFGKKRAGTHTQANERSASTHARVAHDEDADRTRARAPAAPPPR